MWCGAERVGARQATNGRRRGSDELEALRAHVKPLCQDMSTLTCRSSPPSAVANAKSPSIPRHAHSRRHHHRAAPRPSNPPSEPGGSRGTTASTNGDVTAGEAFTTTSSTTPGPGSYCAGAR